MGRGRTHRVFDCRLQRWLHLSTIAATQLWGLPSDSVRMSGLPSNCLLQEAFVLSRLMKRKIRSKLCEFRFSFRTLRRCFRSGGSSSSSSSCQYSVHLLQKPSCVFLPLFPVVLHQSEKVAASPARQTETEGQVPGQVLESTTLS